MVLNVGVHVADECSAYLVAAVFVRVLGASSAWGCETVCEVSLKEVIVGSYKVVHPDVYPSD